MAERDRGRLEYQVFLLKGPCMDLITDRLTHSEFQCWGSSLKVTRDTQGGTNLSGFRVRARGATFAQTEVLAEIIVI